MAFIVWQRTENFIAQTLKKPTGAFVLDLDMNAVASKGRSREVFVQLGQSSRCRGAL